MKNRRPRPELGTAETTIPILSLTVDRFKQSFIIAKKVGCVHQFDKFFAAPEAATAEGTSTQSYDWRFEVKLDKLFATALFCFPNIQKCLS